MNSPETDLLHNMPRIVAENYTLNAVPSASFHAKLNTNFYFKSLQWSDYSLLCFRILIVSRTADGTSVISDSSDDKIRTFVV